MPSSTAINSFSGARAVSTAAVRLESCSQVASRPPLTSRTTFSPPLMTQASLGSIWTTRRLSSLLHMTPPWTGLMSMTRATSPRSILPPFPLLLPPSSHSPVPASSRHTTCHFFELELETIEESSEEENNDDDESSNFGEEDLLLTPVLTPHDFARSQPPMEEVMELLISVDETPVKISSKLGLSHFLPQRTFDDVADLDDQIRAPSPCPSLESPFSSPSADYLLPEADFPYPSSDSLLHPPTQHHTEAPQPTIWEIEALLDIQETDKIAVEPTQSFLWPKLPWVTAPPISLSTSDELPMSSFELDQMLLYSPRESILAMLGIRPTPEILDIIVNVPQEIDTSGLETLSTVSTTSSASLDVLVAVAGFQQRLPGC